MSNSNGSNVLQVTDGNLSDLLKQHSLLVVDCYADWCAPCRMVAPIIEELAGEYSGRVSFGKVDVDQNNGVAGQFGIRGIPTLLFFKDGSLVDQQVGALPKPALKQRLEGLLAG